MNKPMRYLSSPANNGRLAGRPCRTDSLDIVDVVAYHLRMLMALSGSVTWIALWTGKKRSNRSDACWMSFKLDQVAGSGIGLLHSLLVPALDHLGDRCDVSFHPVGSGSDHCDARSPPLMVIDDMMI